MNRTSPKYLVALGLFAALTSSLTASQQLFIDTFSNGNINNSDHVNGYWQQGSLTQHASESGGNLLVNLPGEADSTSTQTYTMRSTGNAPTFNFFANEVTFAFSGLSVVTPPSSPGTNEANSLFQLLISPSNEANPTSTSNIANGFGIRIRASDVVTLGSKSGGLGGGIFAGDNMLVNDTTISSSIIGFSITLDATSYTVNIATSSGNHTPLTGTHGLSLEDWGAGGQSSMGIVIQSFVSSGSVNATDVTLSQIEVTQVPEAAHFAVLLAVACAATLLLAKRRSAKH